MFDFVFYIFLNLVGGCTGAVQIESSNDPIDIDDRPIDVDSGGKGIFCSGSLIYLCPIMLPLISLIVTGETNYLCKGNNNEVVDIDPTDVDGQCQYSVSAPAHMPQEDCSVKEEISRLDSLFSFSNYEVCNCFIWNGNLYSKLSLLQPMVIVLWVKLY